MDEELRKKYDEMRKAMLAFNKEFGGEINKAIPMYEDPTRYPVQELIDLFKFQWKFKENANASAEIKAELKKEYAARRDAIKLLPNAPDRIYLWNEGNMPAETEYTDNAEHRYDHEPDFKPYYLEMLIPEDKTPIGGIVLVAGGTHGAGTINECYQIGLEFNALGYQCFILQCRPNMSPWSRLETATDAARCFQLIRSKKDAYRLDPTHLAYAGFSNGGVTGDSCIEFYSEGQKVSQYFPGYTPDEIDELPGGPNAYLCVYGARHIGTKLTREYFAYPPTFFAIGRKDFGCIDNLYKNLLPWLQERNVPVEIHTFSGHPHGYAGWKIIDGKGDYNFDIWVTHADVFLRDLFVGYDPNLFG